MLGVLSEVADGGDGGVWAGAGGRGDHEASRVPRQPGLSHAGGRGAEAARGTGGLGSRRCGLRWPRCRAWSRRLLPPARPVDGALRSTRPWLRGSSRRAPAPVMQGVYSDSIWVLPSEWLVWLATSSARLAVYRMQGWHGPAAAAARAGHGGVLRRHRGAGPAAARPPRAGPRTRCAVPVDLAGGAHGVRPHARRAGRGCSCMTRSRRAAIAGSCRSCCCSARRWATRRCSAGRGR